MEGSDFRWDDLLEKIEKNYIRKGIDIDLKKEGIDVNAKDRYGDISLIKAESPRMIEFLLNQGADVNLPDDDGNSLFPTVYKNTELMETLIALGADINIRDRKGEIALHKASAFGYIGSIRCLIDAGADLNVQDSEGNTPLMQGLARIEVAKLLVEAGADLNIKNKEGYDALSLAKKWADDNPIHIPLYNYLASKDHHSKTIEFSEQGWKLTEHWMDRTVSSPETASNRRKISGKIESMKKDIMYREDLPFGASIVFGKKQNAEEIADLLKTAGGTSVEVQVKKVQYDKKTNRWHEI